MAQSAPSGAGPWPGEPPVARHGPFAQVAVLPDVHANMPALLAVLAEAARCGVDSIVFAGDLTWGPEPEHTVATVRELGGVAVCVRGNCDRAVVRFARGMARPRTQRDRWMAAAHTPATVDFLAGFAFSAVVDVVGLGPVLICHGSPRADNEALTPLTPAPQVVAATAATGEKILALGHSHLRFDRTVAGLRLVGPGSVGLPHHGGGPGEALWAILGPDVEFRCTRYDAAEAVSRAMRVGDPEVDALVARLTAPPTPDTSAARFEAS